MEPEPRVRALTASHPFQVLRPSGPFAALDSHRAWRPSVLRGSGSSLLMWYGGHDGTTNRILAAEQRPRDGWGRLGVCVEAGFAGRSDAAGVDAPAVVRTEDGFVMAYVGSDGKTTRAHVATSADGESWRSHGPVGPLRAHTGATAPSLVPGGAGLRLYLTATGADGRPRLVTATSADGSSWVDEGVVDLPATDAPGPIDPWVVAGEEGYLLLHVRPGPEGRPAVALATSPDGLAWADHPAALDLGRRHHDAGAISGPSAARLRSGSLRVWYAAGAEGDAGDGCRLWSADVGGAPG
jgi:hypothetical protein